MVLSLYAYSPTSDTCALDFCHNDPLLDRAPSQDFEPFEDKALLPGPVFVSVKMSSINEVRTASRI